LNRDQIDGADMNSTLLHARFLALNKALRVIATENGFIETAVEEQSVVQFARGLAGNFTSIIIDHLDNTVSLVTGGSKLTRKRLSVNAIQATFKNPTIDTFLKKNNDSDVLKKNNGSDDDDSDSDVDGEIEELENLMSSSSNLRPSVAEITNTMATAINLPPAPPQQRFRK